MQEHPMRAKICLLGSSHFERAMALISEGTVPADNDNTARLPTPLESESARPVRGPYLQQLSERDVTVVFDTDLPTTGTVEWGKSEKYGESAHEPIADVHHSLRVSGLRPGTVSHCRVRATDGATTIDAGDAWFHSPPAHGISRFIVYGDMRSGHEVHAALNRPMATEDPDFALVTGDLVARGSDDADWNRFFEIATDFLRQVAIFPAPGNHDYGLAGRGLALLGGFFRSRYQPFDPSYYSSFDISGIHFVALDSNRYATAAQREWFEQDLAQAEARHARAIFVYGHEPPYSMGVHGNNAVCISDYVPIMVRHHVAMFSGGHDHHYERGRVGAFNYLVTGGAGAELRAPRCGVEGAPPCPPSVFRGGTSRRITARNVQHTTASAVNVRSWRSAALLGVGAARRRSQ